MAGAPNGEKLPRPVDSLFLVQGTLSLWSYCPDIPVARIYLGTLPFLLADFVLVSLLIAVPGLVSFLPSLLKI